MLKTLNYNELSSLGVKVKQREVNAKEFKEVKNQNIDRSLKNMMFMASKELNQFEILVMILINRDKAYRIS